MKYSYSKVTVILLILSFCFCNSLFSWPYGVSGKTKKTTTSGCGSCHFAGTTNSAVFSGPDTVYRGQEVTYSLIINKNSNGTAGVDIAAFNGLLDTSSSCIYMTMLNGELVHIDAIPINNSISLNFKYIAPNYNGTDTLYATFAIGYPGVWRWAPNKVIYIKQSIGIQGISEPVRYELFQNYPNPFNPYTIISYSLKYNTFVNLGIYNIEGKHLATLVNGYQKTGDYKVPFSISQYPLSSGIYYYRLITDNSSEVKSMMLIK